jgi:hypothetical protein
MATARLVHTTGHASIDDCCIGLLELCACLFPDHAFSAYLQGSYAEQQATTLSDIDLTIVFADELSAAQRERFATLIRASKRLAPYALDVVLLTLPELAGLAAPDSWKHESLVVYATTVKNHSHWLFGQDIRDRIPTIPPATATRVRMHFAIHVLAGQRGHPPRLSAPLAPPDPADPFLGYTARRLRGSDHRLHPSTKRLIHGTGHIVTGLVALMGHGNSGSRRHAIDIYCGLPHAPWSAYLQELDAWCYRRWQYAVPTSAAEQALLQRLCAQTVAFENDFLDQYAAFLLQELQSPDAAIVLHSLTKMRKITIVNEELLRQVHALREIYPQAVAEALGTTVTE